ncbi:hypothetical protein [Ochrovirga pacifica]|uniref:hypothetical protein n=1 Tax=Ochrovirga pacifica TaxID=1042376 RepID=UPI0002558B0A|nr:hypothetical protein [Ochrovirga pacifica]
MKQYNSLEEINRDLNILQLKRQIAVEEIKKVKGQTLSAIQPVDWIQTYLYKKLIHYGWQLLFSKKNKAS